MRGQVLIIATLACVAIHATLIHAQVCEDDESFSTEFRENLLPAQTGDPQAQLFVGYLYETGQGVEQNFVKAAQWYQKSAEQGNALAQLQLGTMYINGKGVPQNFVLAYLWLDLASAQGNISARNRLEALAKQMGPARVAEAKRLAVQWKAKK
ncbi:MAG TPA: sel1 repeat family protein [Deltaproteobacteria bacterium]|nr:sel1 repeat family protein [Deltaproteobacteria bacterium]